MQNMPTATELAIKYAKREQLRIIIDKALRFVLLCLLFFLLNFFLLMNIGFILNLSAKLKNFKESV